MIAEAPLDLVTTKPASSDDASQAKLNPSLGTNSSRPSVMRCSRKWKKIAT